MTCHALRFAEEKQRALLLVGSQSIFQASRVAINRGIGEDETEFKFRGDFTEHVEVDRRAIPDFGKYLSKQLLIGDTAIQTIQHFSTNCRIVSRKSEAGNLDSLIWWNERLRNKQLW